jgi:hypothetical protein
MQIGHNPALHVSPRFYLARLMLVVSTSRVFVQQSSLLMANWIFDRARTAAFVAGVVDNVPFSPQTRHRI